MKVREGKEKMGEEGKGSGWFSWRMKKGKRDESHWEEGESN